MGDFMDNRIILAERSLKKNGFKVRIFDKVDKAKEALMEDIGTHESIGFGGSMTLSQMGVYEDFKNRGNKVYWHWMAEDKKATLKEAQSSDIYLSSTNALTLDGKLVNMDGTGNRVSSIFYGHKRVYIIVGRNKICKDYDEAIDRIKNVASPKNAERLNIDTPCKFTGKCNDCNSPNRICNVEVIIHKNTPSFNINVFLIDEDLGY